jgi:predicted DNA-binding protein (MmcQ/YjbR family)
MNKEQLNTVILDVSMSQGEVERRMDNSYILVISKMTKKDQQSLIIALEFIIS